GAALPRALPGLARHRRPVTAIESRPVRYGLADQRLDDRNGQRFSLTRASDAGAIADHSDAATLLALTFHRCLPRHLGACEGAIFLGKDAARPQRHESDSPVLDWIISLSFAVSLIALGIFAQSKMGTVRKKDQRPHQLPWGLIMIGCVFGFVLVVVHILNIIGVETGPEHGLLGTF
ncbi:MAG: hypothetical protein AAFR82_10335, partial [Pseudomonadota bacterium]